MVVKKKVIIFKGLEWFDDSFYELDNFRSPNGWTVNLGSLSTDGDIATLDGEIEASIDNLNSSDYDTLVARFVSSTGSSLIKIWNGSSWINVKELGSSIGEITKRIPSGHTISKVAISSTSGPVKIDYIGIATEDPFINEDDIISMSVDLQSTVSTGQARINIWNKNKQLNDIDKRDRILVFLGDNEYKKVFGGKIEKVRRPWPKKVGQIITNDLGKYGLAREFAEDVDASFVNTVTTIISNVTYDAVQNGDFTLHGVETIIDRSTGTEAVVAIDYSQTNIQQALQNLATALQNTSGIQADFKMSPSGDLKFYETGTKDGEKTITEEDIVSSEIEPTAKIINKVVLYTPNITKIPSDRDGWTEDPTTDIQWVGHISYDDAYSATASVSPDPSKPYAGRASKKFVCDVSDGSGYAQVDLDLGSGVDLTDYIRLFLRYYAPYTLSETSFDILLSEDMDSEGVPTNYYSRTVTITTGSWKQLEYKTGSEADGWATNGSISDWTNIRYIILRFNYSTTLDIDFWWDELYFAKGPGYHTLTDTDSINEHGLEVGRYKRDDIKQQSDADNFMQGIISMYKDDKTSAVVVVKGDADYEPGYYYYLDHPEEDVEEYLRATRVTHNLRGGKFTTSLNLTVTASAYWMAPDTYVFGRWRRMTKWATLGSDILPIWG